MVGNSGESQTKERTRHLKSISLPSCCPLEASSQHPMASTILDYFLPFFLVFLSLVVAGQ